MQTVTQWLRQLDLEQYAQAFADNHIDLDLMGTLSEADLERLGVTSMGHRKKLLRAITALDSAAPSNQAMRTSRAPERRQLTVMFCDLVGSTALSAKLDPEELREVVRAYQAACATQIARYAGHIAQYLGDGLLVYFGHPMAHEDDAARAVHAGLDILRAMGELEHRMQSTNQLSISVRIGVHTGMVVLGEMGEGERQETLALGETPNIAARIQAMAPPGALLISASTQQLVQGVFEVRTMGAQSLKGVAQPVAVYEVVSARATQDRLGERVPLSTLVGRDQELGLLTDRWERALEGQGQVVLLLGEPGIGKSRLVRAMDQALGTTPHQRLELRCSPLYTQTPLYPVVEALPRLLGWEASDSAQSELRKLEATLARLGLTQQECLPLLALLLARAAPSHPLPPMTPQRQRRRTLETLAALLTAVAAELALVLVIEDLHWADPTTVEWIGHLVEQAPTAHLLMLLSARPGFQQPWGTRSYLTPVLLNRLTQKQTQALALQVSAGKALPEEVMRQITSKTDGVPLFVEELTKSVLESNLLRRSEDHYELTGSLPALAIPSSLQDILMARLDRLSKGRALVQLAAVLGRSFPFTLIQIVSELDEAAVQEALDELVGAELLFQKGYGTQAIFTFKHALLQDAAYQSLLKRVRQQLHGNVAQALVSHFDDEARLRPEHVAHHYTEAGMALEAAQYWLLAGERSAQTFAFAEALAHYRKGIAIIAALPASKARAEIELALLLGAGVAIVPLKGYTGPEVAEIYAQASEVAEALDDKPRQVQSLWGLSLYHWVGSSIDKGREVAQRSLRIAQQARDLDSVLAARHNLACTAMAKGDLGDAREQFEALLSAYGETPRPNVEARFVTELRINALHFFALTLWIMGYPARAMACHAQLTQLCAATRMPYNQIWRAVGIGQLSPWYGSECMRYVASLDADLALCAEQDMMFIGNVIETFRHIVLAYGDPRAERFRAVRQSIESYRLFGAEFSLPNFLALLAGAELRAGHWEASRQSAQEGLLAAQRTGELRMNAELHRILGECHCHAQVRDEVAAESAFGEALRIAREQQAKSFELRAACSLAKLWDAQGKRRAALQLLAPVYDWFTEGFDTQDLLQARNLLHMLRT